MSTAARAAMNGIDGDFDRFFPDLLTHVGSHVP
jgi:hypothetical protein